MSEQTAIEYSRF